MAKNEIRDTERDGFIGGMMLLCLLFIVPMVKLGMWLEVALGVGDWIVILTVYVVLYGTGWIAKGVYDATWLWRHKRKSFAEVRTKSRPR